MKTLPLIVAGAAAGAAGATVLNIVTYLDMTVRARGASSAPEDMVEKLADLADVEIPGDDDAKQNRLTGLGALSGLLVGVGVGALLGATRALGWRPSVLTAGLVTTGAAMLGSDGPLTALKLTDPRTWKPADWASDVIPHLAYGLTTAGTLASIVRGRGV